MNHAADPLIGLSPLQRAAYAIKELRVRLDAAEAAERARTEPIAIVGMGCRFPGGANSPEKFWELLRDGVDAITEVPRSRWNMDEYYDADPAAAWKMYTREGGFLREQVDAFDARFFGIAPREAAGLDPQQRLLLEVSWEAIEHAGIAPDRLAGSSTGVYIGVITADYGMIHPFHRVDPLDLPYMGTGSATSFPAGRISYVLGLQGPCMVVATACSSALVSAHLAMQALRNGECDLALAGGVNLMFAPEMSITLSRMRALAPDGRCKTFDAGADGYGRGEGCGVVVLKRLSSALRDGDTVWAVLKGSAVNHDGASGGLSVPNGPAQEAVLRQALASAGVAPHEVDYIEAHGTGTALGDPIEANALDAVMSVGRFPDAPLLVGSVKTNIGHLEAAAGIAGLIKVALALRHQSIPPNLHFHHPNPHIDWERACISIPTKSTPWPAGTRRRLAGVSSFGLSGINAHLVMEEAPVQPTFSEETRPAHILTLSAKTESALRELAGKYAEALDTPALSAAPLADICGTANAGRAHFEYRASIAAAGRTALHATLQDLAAGRDTRASVHGRIRAGQRPKVAFLFTGQGSQYAGMGRQLYQTHAGFREILDRSDAALLPSLGRSLLSVMHDGPDDLLEQTAYAQPALFALSVALAELWKSWGVIPGAVMGHSVGEYAAACIAGVFSLEEGLRLIAERGRLMQALPVGGAMAAVFAESERVSEMLGAHEPEVVIAAVNGPRETVISGHGEALERAVSVLEAAGMRTRPLRVSHAFHSPLMEPMLSAFRSVAADVPYASPRLDFISNVDGGAVAGTLSADYWIDHIRRPVQFANSIATLARAGYDTFVEIGPHPVLLGLGGRCLPEANPAWLPSLRRGRSDWQELMTSLGALYVRGCSVALKDVSGPHRKVVLPTYPFQRQRYWVELVNDDAPQPARSGHPLLGARLQSAARAAQFEARISAGSPAFLADHRVFGVPILPAAAYVEMALAASFELPGAAGADLEDLVFLQPMRLAHGATETVQLIADPRGEGAWDFEIFRRSGADILVRSGRPRPDADREVGCGPGGPPYFAAQPAEGWELHCKGRIRKHDQTGGPTAVDVEALRERCSAEVLVPAFYQELRDSGLDYGPAFQALEKVWSGSGEALGQIRLPQHLADAADYRLHPVILDACLQALGAALPVEHREGAYLPVALERFRYYRHPGTEVWVHAEFHPSQKAGALSASLRLFSSDGQIVAAVERIQFAPAARDPLREWMYEVVWQEQALPAPVNTEPRRWLILGESVAARDLAAKLRASGHDVSLSEADPSVDAVVYMGSLTEPPDAEPDDAALHHSVRLLGVVQALAKHRADSPPALFVVTRGAAPAEGNAMDLSGLAQSPLLALGKAIAAEHPESRCRTIDLDPSAPAQETGWLYNELTASTREDHVAFLGSSRLAARLARSRVAQPGPASLDQASLNQASLNQASLNQVSLDNAATYLITGGLGGLALRVAQWMVTRGARHIVLSSRRGLTEDVREHVRALRESGAEVRIAPADVARREDVARVLLEIAGSGHPLRGVIHAAGVLDDGILVQQTPERFAGVMDPKVRGAWHLHKLTEATPLDFFVLFSSAASLMGKPGQSNYVAANGFLDGLAHYRRSRGLPCLSINWGAWSAVGAAARFEQGRLEKENGIGAMTPTQGVQMLQAALALNPVQVGIMPLDWMLLDLPHPSPFFSAFTTGTTQARPEFRAHLETMPVSERPQALLEHVCAQVRQVSGLRDDEELEPQQGFFALGLDSLMSVELRNRLQSSLGCSLPVTIAFQHPSAEALAGHLAGLVLRTPAPQAPSHTALEPDRELDALLNSMDLMSDAQAHAALTGRVARD